MFAPPYSWAAPGSGDSDRGIIVQPPLMIEASGLTKSFGPARVVTGLDMRVPAGAAICLLGPNGAGKTTIVRMLTTLLRPDAGWARVAGHDVQAHGAAVRQQIGLSGQYASVDECMTGRANLVMIGELGRLPRGQAKRRAADLLAQFGLKDAAGRAVRTYSGGMRRRLDLAASLIGRPRVLFLDEPTTGLDPGSRLLMWDIIRSLLAEDGVTVLLTTQYLEEADRLADRIAVIDHGRVTAEGTAAELKAGVGGNYLEVTATAGADLRQAMTVLAQHACGPVRRSGPHGRFEVPVSPRAGLVTDVVRDLDAEGIAVDDIVLRRPSLDDVFFALTSQPAPA
jgi:daunorubicin resistance ABC transporter ATP-binding subunit